MTSSGFEQELGRRIARLRAPRFTQQGLADELGISRNAVMAWEKGTSVPDTVNLVRLADLFRVTLDSLAGREPLPPSEVTDEDFDDLLAATSWLESALRVVVDALRARGAEIELPPKPLPHGPSQRRRIGD